MEQVKNEQTICSAAVYCRLSKDDEQAGESVSIETQKMMLTDYCHERGFSIYETYENHTYTYGNTSWADLLTAFDGYGIAYEGQTYNYSTGTVSGTAKSGNPICYYNGTRWDLTWTDGRRLASADNENAHIVYTYDLNGIRTGKTVGTKTYSYLYASGKLLQQTDGTNTWNFVYTASGAPFSMTYNGTTYYYITNQMGNVMYLVNASGTRVATYTYDPYGKVLTATGSMASINPLRYRGYYYDTETGFYYVSSRYYDPEIGRWINADIPETLTADFENFAQYNLFAYCFNNPVNMSDETGTWPSWATKLAIGVGAIVIGAAVVAATAATGGAAAAFVGAAVAGLKAAAVSGAIGAAVGAGTSAVSHRVSTGSWSGAGKAAVDGAVDGFANGFMTGGIMAGGSQILSSGFKVAANAGVPTGRNGGLTIGNKVRVLSPNHPQAYEAGGTLLKIGSKYKNIRFDVGSNSLFHMNIQLAKTANYHLPIGMLGAGLWGGIARD